MITASTRVAGVIGDPVRHSLSPVIHNAAFAAASADWVFVAFEVPGGDAGAALDAMRTLGIGGLAVTMPHKEQVADSVDVLDDAAAALRSVNTVVRRPDGRLAGYNTDGAGFVASLADAGVDPAGMRVVVLGAGGAARAVIDALARSGAARIDVVNRSAPRAVTAAALAGERGHVGTAADIPLADLLVNATSLGMGAPGLDAGPSDPRDVPCDLNAISGRQVVADLVYHPLETNLLAGARRLGALVVDGLGMLVHQAALQQELWTGVRPDPMAMRIAAEQELAARALLRR